MTIKRFNEIVDTMLVSMTIFVWTCCVFIAFTMIKGCST